MTQNARAGHALVLSATSRPQLDGYARLVRDRLAELLGPARSAGSPTFDQVAYTLQVGRSPLAHRLAVVVADLPEAVAALDAHLAGEPYPGLSVAGAVAASAAAPDIAEPTDEAAAASAWLAGHDVDWRRWWADPPRRVSLPTRPWTDSPPSPATGPTTGSRVEPASGPAVSEPSTPKSAASQSSGSEPDKPEPTGSAVDVEAAQRYLVGCYAEVSGIAVEQVQPHRRLDELGLSSFLISRINARLEQDLGETDRTLFFSHPDLAGVAQVLARRYPARFPAGPVPAADPPARPGDVADTGQVTATGSGHATGTGTGHLADAGTVGEVLAEAGELDAAMAVIGLAGRYPNAPDLARFWDNLVNGRDSVGRIPAHRARPGWPADTMWGGFLDDVESFDPLLFNITPRDAELMDPQERLFLEVVWEALEDAGYTRARLRERHDSRVAVYAGAMHNEYPYFGVESSAGGRRQDTGATLGGIANRVSFFLDLHGPSMSVDTMCSSSLTALHLAVRTLRAGESQLAIVGGVNLSLHPNKFVQQHRMKLNATDHRCRSFGAGGDGFVPAEGAGVLVLKPLRQARADGDRIHAVIRGSAVVHAGRTNGYLVPNPQAQGDMVIAALRDAGVDPATIGYLEAHGAGTALGDPVEIAGLLRAFGDAGLPPGSVAIGSVKSTIGHVESAAGIAGLTKVILQMRHGEYAPSLHAEELNPNIEWDTVPFRVQRERAVWPRGGQPRRAGVSSFGAGGTIAHVVVEEAPAPVAAAPDAPAGPQILVLSGYDERRLGELAGRLLAALRPAGAPVAAATDPAVLVDELSRISRGHLPERLAGNGAVRPEDLAGHLLRLLDPADDTTTGQRPALADVAYTLQVGREPLRERLAAVVTTLDEACDVLAAVAEGRDHPRAMRGRAPAGEANQATADATDLAALGRAFVAGAAVDWERLHPGPRRLVDLPHYPFARMRCWAPDQLPAAAPVANLADQPPRSETSQEPPEGPGEVPLYEPTWLPAGPIAAGGSVDGRLLCVFAGHSEPVARAVARLAGPDRVLLVREGGDLGDGVPGYVTTGDATRFAADLLDRYDDLSGWLDLADLYRPDAERGLWRPRLALLQRLTGRLAPGGLRVLQVTSGLQPLDGPAPSLAGARVAGFVRVMGAEYRRLAAAVLDTDVPATDPDLAAAQILGEWATDHRYGEVCHRDGQRYRPGLRHLDAPHRDLSCDPAAGYLVTGGTRGLGALVARFLADRGARRLALLGMRPIDETDPDSTAAAAIRDLRARGVQVLWHTGPLTDRAALGTFLDRARRDFGRLDGVVHCAGRGTGEPPGFAAKDLAHIDEVLEPKTDGLESLLELTAPDQPRFVLLFSSVCAAVPAVAAGATDYAAANAYLDFTAARRGRAGDTTIRSINWPQWSESGGGRDRQNPCRAVGLGTLSDEAGLRVLERVLALPGASRVLPAVPLDGPVDPQSLLPLRPNDQAPTTSSQTTAPAPATSAGPAPGPAEDGPSGPPDWLVEIFATALRLPATDLDPTATFSDLGVDSIMLGELLRAIEQRLDRPLEPATLLDYPSLRELSDHLGLAGAPTGAPQSGPQQVSEAATGPRPEPESPRRTDPEPSGPQPSGPAAAGPDERIAIIGMACRFPDAPDLETFWSNLLAGHDAVREVPATRWDHRIHYRPERELGFSISKWGGYVDGIEDFDPEHFHLDEAEAAALDPAIRMVLETTTSCLRDAGYQDGDLAGGDVGVFVGARMSDYGRRVGVSPSVLRSDQNFIAAYVGHHFDFRGPNLVVDSACSSSLVSVQLAARSLLAGESTVAVAGGVEVLLDEADYLDLSAARALSPSGRCATFDADADGFVPGEGCGLVLLKPLAAALADGDRIYAVIEATAVNNDGRTMGVTTPNPQAQGRVVQAALRRAGRRPEEIGLIEAHGTGTLIGDPIELRALTDVFTAAGPADRTGWCAIGSVKSNIGHLLSAAGVAGLIKVALAVERGEIPATLHCDRPNPRFDFAASPFTPNTSRRPWDTPPERRVAGISSFGMGGTNAHAVVSGLDPRLRSGRPPAREKLPPPRFARRRLWLGRPEETAATANGTAPDSGATSATSATSPTNRATSPTAPTTPTGASTGPGGADDGLIASILDLRLTTPGR